MNMREVVDAALRTQTIEVSLYDLQALVNENDALRDRLAALESGWQWKTETTTLECTCPPPPLSDYEEAAVDAITHPNGQVEGPVESIAGMMPPGFSPVVEIPEVKAAPKAPAFLLDKGNGNPENQHQVRPWRSKFTPNQVQLVIRMAARGEHRVTIAAQVGLTAHEVTGMMGAWKTQIGLLRELEGDDFERQMASMIRQMEAEYSQSQSAKQSEASEGV